MCVGLLVTLRAAAQVSPTTPELASGTVPAASAPATPQAADGPTLQAREHFAEATKLYKDGDFDAALVQFERAYALKPNYKVLYNIGQSYVQLHRYVAARDALNRYLSEGGAQVDADRQAAVQKDIADLELRLAKLTLSVNVVGATVLVDGKKVGITPLTGPIALGEGERALSVEAPNRGVLQRKLHVAGGDAQALTLTFADPPQKTAGNGSLWQDTGPRLGAGFWVTTIGAAALGVGASVTGYLAFQTQDDNRRQRKTFGVTFAQLSDSHQRATNLALTTDIWGSAAVVCAGVATLIFVTSKERAHGPRVGLSFGPNSAALNGSF
jgi:Tetratricopeptide repeat/PEGA domain